ncbi:phosphatase PAP2 family protein [Halorussus sp. MSC15.2]|uniref:phosphatase PAP2 family protein n=1 Tax=Halorussus sp. MSC15.2 TaxID=2283638 RepID=UPI0013D76496|nr:phosphatase PAP2 family protein [Halorussus sp. MSC15.2]NEU58286.1 phosphatase PAP2 family protein [Halorussus sp. MSC15.2]
MTATPVVGHEIGEFIRQVIPPWLIPVFVLITRIGNPAFFLALFVLDYWFADHERGSHAIGLAIAGMALVTALKTFFDAPRPSEMTAVIPISGYSFPSGHATGSTIGYGILAYDLEVGSRRSRYAVAAVLVALIALSRVVLGVHFVRDVVAGMIIGVLFLAAAFALTEHDPREAFVLALAFGALAFVVSGASHDGVAVLGAAVGGALTWEALDSVPTLDSLRSKLLLLVGILPVLLGIGYAGTELDVPLAFAFVANAAVMAGALAAPVAAERFG